MSCFKKQVFFLLEAKEGEKWEKFCFCFYSVVCKKHHQMKNRGILPDSLIVQLAETINPPNLSCILPL